MENLIEQLNGYSKYGIPKNQDLPDYPQGQCPSIDALYKLEEDWRDIVDCSGKFHYEHIIINRFERFPRTVSKAQSVRIKFLMKNKQMRTEIRIAVRLRN